ncbi:MAG: BON domain-containing protein [Planctomycetia bacterium]
MSISRATFLTAIVAASFVTAAVRADDLAATVANRLRDTGAMKGYRVNVKAKSGTVWLEGVVSNPKQIEAAVAAAENVEGVERVVNRLSIADKEASAEGKAFALPSSIRSLAGMPAVAAETQSNETTAAAEEASPIQLTAAVEEVAKAPAAKGRKSTARGQATYGSKSPAMAKAGPRPLGAPTARPMQQRGGGRPQAVRTSMRQPMDLPGPGGYSEGVVGERVIDGGVAGEGYSSDGGVGDGQMVPGSMRFTEGPAGAADCPPGMAGSMGGRPMPMGGPGGAGGGMAVPVRGGGPNMPNYAWPSYASYPNYAALQYPTQYSPTAWPYIGPFYPYPQVPLGWRRVSLEWDDGWWWLDFDERHMHSHHR